LAVEETDARDTVRTLRDASLRLINCRRSFFCAISFANWQPVIPFASYWRRWSSAADMTLGRFGQLGVRDGHVEARIAVSIHDEYSAWLSGSCERLRLSRWNSATMIVRRFGLRVRAFAMLRPTVAL
jgi:hypothetical protein